MPEGIIQNRLAAPPADSVLLAASNMLENTLILTVVRCPENHPGNYETLVTDASSNTQTIIWKLQIVMFKFDASK